MEQKELLTVIVADDETELREAVCSMIPGKEIGFRLVGSAGNGLDALQLVEQLQPDLLLTDIRMPYISGVSLAQQVRELRPLTQIAFLSGYDDFAYAQKAIELGVTRYLLKPTNPRELIAVLEGIEKELNQGREAAMDGKQLSREAEAGPAADGDGVGNLLVQKAIQYVEVHYGGRITLKDMSEELHLSPNYLCELFKRHTGKNLMEYVTEYRMMKARTYLNHVEYKVSDVAEMVGYKEAKYFSSTFKKIYGMTPLEYRNKR